METYISGTANTTKAVFIFLALFSMSDVQAKSFHPLDSVCIASENCANYRGATADDVRTMRFFPATGRDFFRPPEDLPKTRDKLNVHYIINGASSIQLDTIKISAGNDEIRFDIADAQHYPGIGNFKIPEFYDSYAGFADKEGGNCKPNVPCGSEINEINQLMPESLLGSGFYPEHGRLNGESYNRRDDIASGTPEPDILGFLAIGLLSVIFAGRKFNSGQLS